jgi:hypothetical protein
MPTYSVRGPDGYLYNINGPEGASEDDIISAAQKFARERAVAEANKPEPETSVLGHAKEFLKGIPAGALGLVESAGTGISALLPENVEKGARETLAKVGKDFGSPFVAEKGYEEATSRKFGEALGSTLPFFALGPLGTAGRVAAGGVGMAAGAGEARTRAEQGGATEGERAAATGIGSLIGATEVLPVFKFVENLGRPLAEGIISKLKRAAATGGAEGLQEAASNAAQNLVEKGLYNPEQGVFTGSGEAFGYGAGVGGLIQGLTDLALGRRAKTVGGTTKEPATPALPYYANPPMVTFPDGTTSSDPAVIEQYRQQQYEQQRYMPGETPAGPMSQGQLLPEGLPTRPGERSGYIPRIEPVEDVAAPQPVAAPEDQGQLDLSTGQTVEQQIEELYRQEEEVKARDDLTQAEKDLEVAKLKLESDIAETDARVETGEVKAKEAERIEALRQVIEEPKVKNIPKLFSQYLVSLGYNKDTPFTPREQNLINRAIDVQLAQPEVEEIEAPVDTQAQTAELESLIPEKGAKPTPQGQPPLTGIPKAKTSEIRAAEEAKMAEAQAAAAEMPVGETMTGEILDGFGLGPRMPIRQRIVGKSLVDPAERTLVRGELAELALNPNIKAPVRTAIKNYINSDIFRTQPDMFTKKGEPRKANLPPTAEEVERRKAESIAKQEAEKQARADRAKKAAETRKAKKEAESAVTRTEPTATGVSPESTVGERRERRAAAPSAARTEAPKATGLGDTKRVPVQPTGRKGAPQPSVSAAKKAETEAKVASNEWNETTNKLLQTSTGPTLAEILAAKKSKKLEGAAALAPDVDADIQAQLKDGDLKGALTNLAGKLDGIAGRITRQLANAIGETKVEVVTNLKDEAGNPVAGLFDPNTNTIKLDSKAGVSSHTVIHEAVHAATSHVLDNKSHPVTRQLQALYDSVKDSLDTAYGATSLDEFVAEAFSNPEFQAKLQAINPKGEPITAWQRFSNTIQNFLRRMVGMEPTGLTSFDKADELISAILSPSPETRDAGSLYMMSMFGKGGEFIDKMVENAKQTLSNKPDINAYHEFFTGTVPQKAKEALRAALPLNALVDIAKKYIPMAPEVDKLVNEKSAAESQRNDTLHNSIMDVSRWESKQTDAVKRAFNNTVYNSTLDQVDPSKPRTDYKTKEQQAQWDALQADWKAIGTDGQAMYKMMRNTYRKMYDEILGIISSRIDSSLSDKTIAETVKGEILRKLSDRGGIEPYFPLTRTGKYWLSYNAFNERTRTPEPYVEAFESARERDLAIEELKKTKGVDTESIEKLARLNMRAFKGAPPTSFASSIIKTMESNGVDTETIEQVMRLYLDTLPESSFAQAFRARKGTLGFDMDATRAFKMKAHSISRQLSNLEYGAKLANLRDQIKEYVRQNRDQTTVDYWDELEKRIEFAMSPQVPYWSKVATSIGFNMTLGFNISSAVVNLTQIPLVVMPYLGGKYGYSETTRALGRAARIFTGSGTERTIETYVPTESGETKRKVKAFWSVDNYDFSKHPELKHLQTLVDVTGKQGQLNRSQIYDILDVDESDSLLSKVNAASGLVFHHGERMNRQVALIATYELELQKLVGKGKDLNSATKEQMEKAAHEAIYTTELTNGGVAAAAAPRLAQSGIGKVAFMFKRYGVSMYYMMFKTAREALKSADPEVRKQAMKQIAGIYGSSALIAGAKGVPLFGIAAMIFNMFRDEDEDDFETSTRKWLGETIYKGPVNALTGLEISGRVGLSDLIFRDQSYNKDQTAIQSLMEQAGGPVLGVANRVERGLSLIGEGETQRGIEQMLPSAIGNGLKSIRYATEGANTLRGDPIVGEVGPWNVFAQSLGFAPANYIQQLEINAAKKKIDRSVTEEKTKLLKQYFIAMREGDSSTTDKLLLKMQDFSRRHPGMTITGETIRDSIAQHMRTSALMQSGITISKGMRRELGESFADYNGDED